jgi:hypothetical protein
MVAPDAIRGNGGIKEPSPLPSMPCQNAGTPHREGSGEGYRIFDFRFSIFGFRCKFSIFDFQTADPDKSGRRFAPPATGDSFIFFAMDRVFFAKIRINREKTYGNRIRRFKTRQ